MIIKKDCGCVLDISSSTIIKGCYACAYKCEMDIMTKSMERFAKISESNKIVENTLELLNNSSWYDETFSKGGKMKFKDICSDCQVKNDLSLGSIIEELDEDDFDENVKVSPENMAQKVDLETGSPISHEEFWGDDIEGGKINHPNHYNNGIEAWDYIISHNMNFLEGNIIKYITRYKHKNGLEDLKKVRQYLDKLIETEYPDED